MATWMIEGEWTGPANPAGDYTRIVHREYITTRRKVPPKLVEGVRKIGAIRYTDGTALILIAKDVTGIHHSKRAPKRLGYSQLIRDCVWNDVDSVDALCEKRKKQDAERSARVRDRIASVL